MGSNLSALVFQPPEVTYLQAKRYLVWLQTSKLATIPAFYIDRKAKVTILFSHGNAEDLGMILEWFLEFSQEVNVNILAYDYEGYGKSKGRPSEEGCYDDIDAAYAFLTQTMRTPPEQIVLYGRSLGSGPSCYLAERLHKAQVVLGGLILQAPLLSIFRVAFNFRTTLPYDMFPNIDRMGNISCPVFVIHGVKDEVVPFWNGQQLFLATPVALRAKPWWVPDGGHNNLETLYRKDKVFFKQISEFLSEWVPLYNYSSYVGSRPSSPSVVFSGRGGSDPAAPVPTDRGSFSSPVVTGRGRDYGSIADSII